MLCHFDTILWLCKIKEYCTLVFQLEHDGFCSWPHIQLWKLGARGTRRLWYPGSLPHPQPLPFYFTSRKQQVSVLLADSSVTYFCCPGSVLMLFLIFLYSFEQCFILTVGDENFVLSPPGLGAHLCMLECSLTLYPCLSLCPCLSLTFPILFPVLFYYTVVMCGRLVFIICVTVT